MQAAVFHEFGQPFGIETVADPRLPEAGVIIAVRACGICRSDWHGWMGHDADIRLPHVPGHELAGEVVDIGPLVRRWRPGDRVTLPFVCGCGHCPQCRSGHHQVCDHQFQPGFTHWGAFAPFVAIDYADTNLVRLPEDMTFDTAASLGCRFVTAFRALLARGQLRPGQWVAVHGCGGVGLAAVMIATAAGAQVVGIDIGAAPLQMARRFGAAATVDASRTPDVVAAVKEITTGGAHVSLDALGSPATCFNSIANLRKRGRHVQVGLMTGDHGHPAIPMDRVIADELAVVGSHGMAAHAYGPMMDMIADGRLNPGQLINRRIGLDQAPECLQAMDRFESAGITIIDRFEIG